MKCEYGCDKIAHFNGKKWVCGDPRSCPAVIKKRTTSRVKTMTTPDENGLTIIQKIQQGLDKIDPMTGKTFRRLRDEKVKITQSQIDPVSGLTRSKLQGRKNSKTQKAFTEKQREDKRNKTKNTLNCIDPSTGMSRREMAGLKISKSLLTVNPETGLTVSQQTGLKNKNNPKWCSSFGRNKASKESLKFFNPLLDSIQDLNLEYYLGVNQNHEYFLIDSTNTIRYYDFTIPSLKIIIEFNGVHFHPNKAVLSEKEWNDWRTPITHNTADEIYRIDCLKRSAAERK